MQFLTICYDNCSKRLRMGGYRGSGGMRKDLTQSLFAEFHYILDKLIMNFVDVIQFNFLLVSVCSVLYPALSF
jgi:hypothetical protein